MYKFKFEIQPATEYDTELTLFLLSMNLINQMTGECVNLAKVVLENAEELNWFVENESAIRNEKCPVISNDAFSVATGISNFYDQVDPDNFSDEIDKIYEYRTSHSIIFAFSGQDLPDMVIAANDSGYEVSCDDESIYKYPVDINSLFSEVAHSIKELD